MPNLKGHVTGAVLMFPVYYTVYHSIGLITGEFYRPSSGVLALAYVIFVVGGDLPDIDAQAAPIRWFTQALVPLMFIASLWDFHPFEDFLFYHLGNWGYVVYIFALVVGGFLVGYTLRLLKHRGFLHTISFAILYAGVIYLWLRWGMEFKGNDLMFTTLAAFFGVYTHLLLDYKNPAIILRIFPKGPFS